MFAILIAEENMAQIRQVKALTERDAPSLNRYIYARRNFYLIRGYVDLHGRVIDWAVLPAYIFQRHFDYDPVKIQTEWNIITRKD